MQDQAQEATINRQPAAAAVFDKTKIPEFIHEITDPRSGGTDHLSQVFLTDPGMHSFDFTFLAKMSQQQENPGQAFLAVVKQLIDEIPFESNVAGRQMREEEFGDAVSLLEQVHQEPLTPFGKASNQLSR